MTEEMIEAKKLLLRQKYHKCDGCVYLINFDLGIDYCKLGDSLEGCACWIYDDKE